MGRVLFRRIRFGFAHVGQFERRTILHWNFDRAFGFFRGRLYFEVSEIRRDEYESGDQGPEVAIAPKSRPSFFVLCGRVIFHKNGRCSCVYADMPDHKYDLERDPQALLDRCTHF